MDTFHAVVIVVMIRMTCFIKRTYIYIALILASWDLSFLCASLAKYSFSVFILYTPIYISIYIKGRGGSRVTVTSEMECFVIIVTIIKKHSILVVTATLDPPLGAGKLLYLHKFSDSFQHFNQMLMMQLVYIWKLKWSSYFDTVALINLLQ